MSLQEQKQTILEIVQEKRKYIDKPFWIILTILAVVSIICMFSSSTQLINQEHGKILRPIFEHFVALAIGFGLAYVIQFVPSRGIRMIGYLGFGFAILCMLLTFTPLGVTINGETRWLKLFGIQFQPSELVKITLMIVVSDLLSRIRDPQNRKKFFWITIGVTLLAVGLILPTNLSTAILIVVVVFILLFLARIPLLWLLGTAAVPLTIMICGYFYVNTQYIQKGKHMNGFLDRAETWVVRVNDMIEGKSDDKSTFRFGDNLQSNMAHVAVAHGGQSPIGVLPGNSWAREKLSQAHSDFIFAIFVEEWGIIGSIFLIFIYLAILFRACYASSRYADYSAMLMIMGLALMLVMQAFISMEVSVGIGPVTGQALPLISHGKTNVVVFCLYFGIMMAVSLEQRQIQAIQERTTQESEETVPDLEV